MFWRHFLTMKGNLAHVVRIAVVDDRGAIVYVLGLPERRAWRARPLVTPRIDRRWPSASPPAEMSSLVPADGAVDAAKVVAPRLDRKVIYRATVELVVEDFSGASERVVTLVRQFDGYVADTSVAGSAGENRRGQWRIRVPVSRLDELVGAVKGLGELVRATTASQDVSEEYYDVDVRIRNKTKEEERLLKLLEERPGKLADVIAIERELSRVREELERIQGRMRVLTDLTSMTTVELSITEIRGYVPPEAPTLATRIARAFHGSVSQLSSSAEQFLIGAVAAAPWLPLMVVGAVVVAVGYRRARRRLRWPSSAGTSG